MLVCIPTTNGSGRDARVFGHFGSAPCFTIADTASGELTVLPNLNAHHAHGSCHPLGQIEGRGVEAIVTGGIGRRALQGLHSAGLKVYQPGNAGTVGEVLAALAADSLAELDEVHACGGHGHGSQAAHGHGHGHGGAGPAPR